MSGFDLGTGYFKEHGNIRSAPVVVLAFIGSFPPIFLLVIPHASTQRYWETRVHALAWRINVAAWLARVAPAVFFVASVFAVTLYALRRAEQPFGFAWIGLGLATVITALGCAWHARRDFFSPRDARVLIESELKLDTRLTAAELGLVAWPEATSPLPRVVRWRLRAPLAWLAATLGLILVAAWAPIPRENSRGRPTGSPPALVQTEAMLEVLKEMKIAEPQAIEQLQDRARELARRPVDEQYSHSALEAADALRNQTAVSAAELARGFDSAANALRAANNQADMNGPAGQLAAALSGLRDSALPANKDLLGNLPASLVDLKNLSPEQREQLAQQLAQAAHGLNGIAGAAGAGASVSQPDPNAPFREGDGFGAGGPGGGGKSGPLALKDRSSDAGQGRAEALSADALKRLALGDKLGTTNSAPEADAAKATAPSTAGAVSTAGSGGEAVWVNRLTPAERAALKNFFK